jgi:hypothetical protein
MQVVSCIPHLSESSPDGRLYISVLRSSRPGRRGCSTQAQTAGGFGGFLFCPGGQVLSFTAVLLCTGEPHQPGQALERRERRWPGLPVSHVSSGTGKGPHVAGSDPASTQPASAIPVTAHYRPQSTIMQHATVVWQGGVRYRAKPEGPWNPVSAAIREPQRIGIGVY